jgi:hypothetical protein
MPTYDDARKALIERWPALAGKTLPEKLAEVNALEVDGAPVPIPAAMILKQWSRWMVLARMEELLDDLRAERKPEMMSARVLLNATLNNLRGNVFGDLDPADTDQAPDIAKYLDGLMALGVLTQDERDKTLGYAARKVSWAVSVGFSGPVSVWDAVKAGLATEEEAKTTADAEAETAAAVAVGTP